MKFDDKTAVITGATGGLGQAVVQAFLHQGAGVVALARHAGAMLSTGDRRLRFIPADVTHPEQVEQAIGGLHAVDFMIHCTGGFKAGYPVRSMEISDWHDMLTVNLESAFLMSRMAMRKMAEQKHGKIVFISALSVFEPRADRAAYIVSKAGLIALTQCLALEGKDINVQVNALAPSIIRTEANMSAMPDMDASKWVTPEDMAATILFLCSPAADGISGTVIKMPGQV